LKQVEAETLVDTPHQKDFQVELVEKLEAMKLLVVEEVLEVQEPTHQAAAR
jgi:hypothetical protein